MSLDPKTQAHVDDCPTCAIQKDHVLGPRKIISQEEAERQASKFLEGSFEFDVKVDQGRKLSGESGKKL